MMNNKRVNNSIGMNTSFDSNSPQRKVTPNTYVQSNQQTSSFSQNINEQQLQLQTQQSQQSQQSQQMNQNYNKNDQSNNSKVKVFIRCRPILPHEETQESSIHINKDDNTLVVQEGNYSINSTFDKAYIQDSTQLEVFSDFQQPISNVLEGYNFTVFAYGQTGSGKTYTMFGSDWESLINRYDQSQKKQQTFFESLESDINYAGIIPRTIYQLFNLVSEKKKDNPDINISIYCSFLQIYNERIFDLLQDSNILKPLNIHESKLDGIFVEGLSEYQVQHYYDTLQLMKRGEKNRTIRATSMNAKSSRSHTIFQLIVETIDLTTKDGGTIKRSRINLCDLAGSEKINKSEVMAGGHLNELRNINLSLTTLGKVIHNLSSKSKLPIPFRESKLTRILQESLVGNTITYIVATISPSISNIDETVSTLKFAERARHITLTIKANQINAKDDEVVKKLQKEIIYLKEILNLRRKGANVGDMHSKFLKLQAENEKLKKDHVSIKEVEKLIEENRKMKTEIQQIYMSQSVQKTNTPDISQQDDPFKPHIKSFEDIDSSLKSLPSMSNSTVNDHHNNNNNQQNQLNQINFTLSNRNHSSPYLQKNSENSISMKSQFFSGNSIPLQNQSKSNRSINIGNYSCNNSNSSSNSMIVYPSTGGRLNYSSNSANKNVFLSNHSISANTPVKIRVRGKQDYHMKNGFIEMSQSEINEQQQKEKKRILERLNQLERIQKYNQEKLQKELDLIDNIDKKSNVQHKKFSSLGQIYDPVKRQSSLNDYQKIVMGPLLSKQKKQLKDYENKIKDLERRYFSQNK